MKSLVQAVAVTLLFLMGVNGVDDAARAEMPSRIVAITGAMIFDATGKAPYRGTVIIRNDRIVDVGPDVKAPAGAQVVNADGNALLPGFFDVHTHWGPSGTPGTIPQIANRYVASGVTTVNDFHQQPESFAPRRAWLANLVAPHVNFIARTSTPNGHGADWGDANTTKWIATPEAARREIQALQPYHPDHIKAFADGWRYGTSPEETSMNLETLSALTDEAHKYGQRVLSHTVTVERGKIAARAGVDVIAHSLQDRQIDAEGIALIKQAGTYYAPTLAIYAPVKPGATETPDMTHPAVQHRFRKYGFAEYNVKALHDAGVPIALGTDAGIGDAQHGTSTLQEMELLVDAGLSSAEALLAGTINSARALGIDADRGTIEQGKRADLVLINGTPWKDIADVHKIDRVFIDGQLVFGPGASRPSANQRTSLESAPAAVLIDDFTRTDGRSSLDTLRLADMDGGGDRSVVVMNLVPRGEGDQALLVTARMAQKETPSGGVIIPLSRGSVQPVDASKFSGIRLELRGEGRYQIMINTLNGVWRADVEGGPEWKNIELPFSAFEKVKRSGETTASWRGDDLLEIGMKGQRPAGATMWAELDNVRFY